MWKNGPGFCAPIFNFQDTINHLEMQEIHEDMEQNHKLIRFSH